MHKVWIEAALNGPWSRARQPGIPDTVEAIVAEGIACARAGAAIIHTHAYDGGGQQTFDWQVYARIIEGIRAEVDVPVYPSIPGLDKRGNVADPKARFAHIEALAERGLLEFAVVDPGSVNFTLTATHAEAKPAETYLNPETHIRHGLDVAARHGIHPAFAIYEPGFIRAGAALARAAGVGTPIYRFMFSQQFAFCFPPKPYGLAALVTLAEEEAAGAPWMVSGLGVDITPLIGDTIARGGHIRVGLEDALLGSTETNLRLVEDAVRLVRANGGEPATTAEVRQALASG
ncbi:3-keto-5-aminohexanoate cleavage protein [Bradyrhizobium diazoefficiens]|nr:3-keto-5-aminohexanoate cleavage protein [Bradyrhizobium diazoefficiens]MBR0966696.1 3-keto-5-aminohexanoate cleavage protein [Bradyrhizobium diazoefficiens]MBR0980208.1 3-keto-5-aminohexanoate cleavage protein [Bradyrhizobium diazoefficiens]MBR1009556.1 3-keto-5-aminohexanoate cleavage protein [Bradyrhizobium diazoefficiens]MBR1016139.1 3-keto-5-aminohexanoate cleavage protein [Bradyrhizobium diazoefficiens]MBR1053517.1 3-keto-5-aminohexanoate cleavage protein [Bradyrhizobium diazoefficien